MQRHSFDIQDKIAWYSQPYTFTPTKDRANICTSHIANCGRWKYREDLKALLCVFVRSARAWPFAAYSEPSQDFEQLGTGTSCTLHCNKYSFFLRNRILLWGLFVNNLYILLQDNPRANIRLYVNTAAKYTDSMCRSIKVIPFSVPVSNDLRTLQIIWCFVFYFGVIVQHNNVNEVHNQFITATVTFRQFNDAEPVTPVSSCHELVSSCVRFLHTASLEEV